MVLFLRYLLSSPDRLIMALRNDLAVYDKGFARRNFFFKGECLFSTSRNTCSKDS